MRKIALFVVMALTACGSSPAATTGPGGAGGDTGGSGGTGAGGAATGGTGGVGGSSGGVGGDTGGSGGTGSGDVVFSAGCGKAPRDASGGVQRKISVGPDGGGDRGYYISVPANYDPSHEHRLILGYPGTNWVGKQIQPYLDLEKDAKEDEIFVYLDPLWRDFQGWGNLGGWELGPNAAPANGNEDMVFTGAVLDEIFAAYCIDESRVFATGHSWGGDMAQVLSCFMGDRFRATVPVAANRPYWFEKADGTKQACTGKPAVWTMFGAGDDYFTNQDYPGQYGDECRDFWLATAKCTGKDASTPLPFGKGTECVEYQGCDRTIRYCLYDPATGHQRPAYYPAATMEFFRSF